MSEDYPDDGVLDKLQHWPIEDSTAALDYLADHWFHYGSVKHELTAHEGYLVHAEPDERFLRLATGGWSGNEELLTAFERSLAYFYTWSLSARGGLHIFRYPPTAHPSRGAGEAA